MSEWIKSSERMPEKYKTVLTYSNGHYRTGDFTEQWNIDNPMCFDEPSYWMTIPEAPQ